MSFFSRYQRFRARRAGAPLLEYALLVGIIGTTAIASISLTGQANISLFARASALFGVEPIETTPNPTAPPSGPIPSYDDAYMVLTGPASVSAQAESLNYAYFTLTNTGGQDSLVLDTSMFSVQGAGFSLAMNNNCEGVLHPGASCMVQLQYIPSGPDPVAGQLTFLPSQRTAHILGIGTDYQARLAWVWPEASATAFSPSTEENAQGLLSNTGNLPTDLSALNFSLDTPTSGWRFVDHNCPTTLAPKAECQVSFAFTPSTDGTFQTRVQTPGVFEDLVLIADAYQYQQPAFPMPDLQWDDSIDYTYYVFADGRGATQTSSFVLENTTDHEISHIAFSVQGTGYRLESTSCGTTIPAGDRCSVMVRFTGSPGMGTQQHIGKILANDQEWTLFGYSNGF